VENKIVNTKLGSFESNLWGYHFLIPKTISEYFTKGNNRRVVVTFNDELKNHCAIMSSQEGPFIMLNKGIVKQLKIRTGDLVKLEITKDNSEYGMPICEEFEAVIFGDEVVFEYFQKLTPGRQRNLIHLVNKIKNPDIKINRSMAIAEHLIEAHGAIDFKELNEKIKEFNQRTRIN
jgi:hypothetical protein